MGSSTIAAVATPIGRGGIGIIRMSGPEALVLAGKLFKPGRPGQKEAGGTTRREVFAGFESHKMYYGHIVDPVSQVAVDEVMLVAMKAPRSYTREDVVEVHSHSGPAILNRILEAMLSLGAHLAEPGEFTRRAFLNGRIDLSQAEAVMDVINARTATSLKVASMHLQGEIRTAVETWRQTLKEMIASIEAENEFSDDTGQLFDPPSALETLKRELVGPLKASINAYDSGHLLRDGLQIVVVGRPNVGKSSLMNRLINKERAIVTDLPGTTRDSIEETLSIRGIPAVITDTAGLHRAIEPVEVLGIRKTHEYIDNADLVLFMVAADNGVTKEDLEIFQQIQTRPVILVINKIDLMEEDFNMPLDPGLSALPSMAVSAKFNRGIGGLKNCIVQYVMRDPNMVVADRAIPKLRHKLLFEESLAAIETAEQELQSGVGPELVVMHLQKGFDYLGQVLGQNTDEDILDQIFSHFCIGK